MQETVIAVTRNHEYASRLPAKTEFGRSPSPALCDRAAFSMDKTLIKVSESACISS